MARKLDSETIARFRQNGHVVVAGLAHEAELEELRTIYDRILADLHGESRDCYEQATVSPQFTWVRKPETVHARLLQLDLFHQARGFAAQLLDLRESALTGSYRIFHKPALIGGATPWHQDAVYKDTAVSHCVHVWIPLDPAHAENGHIRYISGSHRDGLLLHRPSGLGDYNLEALGADTDRACLEPVPLGGAAFHHFHTIHQAGANHSQAERRVMTVVCEAWL